MAKSFQGLGLTGFWSQVANLSPFCIHQAAGRPLLEMELRLSEEAYEAKASERPRRIPRLEVLAIDEHPERELSATQLSKAAMMEILNLQNVAVALCQGAHLHSLKEFSRRFLKAVYEKFSRALDSG